MKYKDKMKPETLMMSYGYKPLLSEGSLKCPIFQTSSFVFKTAQEGKRFFEIANEKGSRVGNEEHGLIYTRLNNPDIEILEDRISLWDEGDSCAVFNSGMAAITTVMLEFLEPGGLILSSAPIYAGTHGFLKKVMPKLKVDTSFFYSQQKEDDILASLEKSGGISNLQMVYIETPANPTNSLIDIELGRRISDFASEKNGREVIVVVDNTYLGPLWQHPLKCGAHFSIYSATKYIGGHSDVVAGAVVGDKERIGRVKALRSSLGNSLAPWDGWLLMRSLETLKLRMTAQVENAKKVAVFLANHSNVEKVYYLENLRNEHDRDIYSKQCLSPGSMVTFDIKGSEIEAFKVLNKLKIFHLAVSLGGTESLAQHPYTMTHASISDAEKTLLGISDKMIRLSVGIEAPDDIISDLQQALDCL